MIAWAIASGSLAWSLYVMVDRYMLYAKHAFLSQLLLRLTDVAVFAPKEFPGLPEEIRDELAGLIEENPDDLSTIYNALIDAAREFG